MEGSNSERDAWECGCVGRFIYEVMLWVYRCYITHLTLFFNKLIKKERKNI